MNFLPILVLLPALTLASTIDANKSDFSWLVGCWVSPDKSAQEVWIADGDRSLAGFAVSINGGTVGFYELISIRQSGDGTWTFTAHPSGQESASFLAVDIGESSVVFANPDHDYPQEIRYRRDGKKLYSSISKSGNKAPKSFDKIACNSDQGTSGIADRLGQK